MDAVVVPLALLNIMFVSAAAYVTTSIPVAAEAEAAAPPVAMSTSAVTLSPPGGRYNPSFMDDMQHTAHAPAARTVAPPWLFLAPTSRSELDAREVARVRGLMLADARLWPGRGVSVRGRGRRRGLAHTAARMVVPPRATGTVRGSGVRRGRGRGRGRGGWVWYGGSEE